MPTPKTSYRARLEPAPKPRKQPSKRRKRCPNCKNLFVVTRHNQKFCKVYCKTLFHRFGPGYDSIYKKLTENVAKQIEEAAEDRLKIIRAGVGNVQALLIDLEARMKRAEAALYRLHA